MVSCSTVFGECEKHVLSISPHPHLSIKFNLDNLRATIQPKHPNPQLSILCRIVFSLSFVSQNNKTWSMIHCIYVKRNSDPSNWKFRKLNVSKITNMSGIFEFNEWFVGDSLSKWHVTDMSHMFMGVISINGDLPKWKVSRVTNMAVMFSNTSSFHSDISTWSLSSVCDQNKRTACSSMSRDIIQRWRL